MRTSPVFPRAPRPGNGPPPAKPGGGPLPGRRALLLAALMLLPALFAAQARAEPVRASYVVRAAGLTVMDVEASFDPADSTGGYVLELRTHMRGVAALFRSGTMTTRASGAWADGRPQPRRYVAQGVWGGEQRSTVLDYVDGQPVLRQLLPPLDADEREPVPAEARRGTMDSLSAVAALLRQVRDSGRCEAQAAVFDGRRRSVLSARTLGWEMLSGDWPGRALHCHFSGRLTHGFKLDDGPAERQRPQEGDAWLAEVHPGGPVLPVRLEVPNRWFGQTTISLVRIGEMPSAASRR